MSLKMLLMTTTMARIITCTCKLAVSIPNRPTIFRGKEKKNIFCTNNGNIKLDKHKWRIILKKKEAIPKDEYFQTF